MPSVAGWHGHRFAHWRTTARAVVAYTGAPPEAWLCATAGQDRPGHNARLKAEHPCMRPPHGQGFAKGRTDDRATQPQRASGPPAGGFRASSVCLRVIPWLHLSSAVWCHPALTHHHYLHLHPDLRTGLSAFVAAGYFGEVGFRPVFAIRRIGGASRQAVRHNLRCIRAVQKEAMTQ